MLLGLDMPYTQFRLSLSDLLPQAVPLAILRVLIYEVLRRFSPAGCQD